MNRKGFTFIELLGVIIILGVVMVITIPLIITSFQKSKEKTEEIFLERLSTSIESYIPLNTDKIKFTSTIQAIKPGEENIVTVQKGEITVEDIIKDNIIIEKDFINPKNNLLCDKTAKIEVYKDSDYVYCHKMKKFSCLSDKYSTDEYVINTCEWEEQ